ncbi:hypothetical protein C1645_687428, partial [Glomus cerebriforme]
MSKTENAIGEDLPYKDEPIQILPNLYLGSELNAANLHGAMLSGVPLVVPATSDFKPLKYKKIFWTHNQENLIADFIPAFAFIDEARSAGRNILVHCQCGVSRSASLIISYVMKVNRMTLNQAYEFVKDRSPYISPNMSLVYQLVEFEKTLK